MAGASLLKLRGWMWKRTHGWRGYLAARTATVGAGFCRVDA
jgi:hypothetical protein